MSNTKNGCIELFRDEDIGLATICINNPRKRNAINGQLMQELSDAITSLEKWKTGKAVVIYGAKGFFSSGIDLTFLAQVIDSKEAGVKYSNQMTSNLSSLKALPLLSVAIIDGMALGGGAEIAIACDLRVMASTAKIGFVHCCIGVSTAWGGGTYLVNTVGYTKALELILSGRILTAREALDLGIVNHLVDTSQEFIDKSIVWVKLFLNNDQEQIIVLKSCSTYR